MDMIEFGLFFKILTCHTQGFLSNGPTNDLDQKKEKLHRQKSCEFNA